MIVTYNLSDSDKEILEKALSILGQTYDQHGFESPKNIFRVLDKIKKCSAVQLITHKPPMTFADEV